MIEMKSILVIDDSFDLGELESLPVEGVAFVLCLFWAAPETMARLEAQTGARCVPLRDVLGSVSEWEREATETVRSICEQGPRRRGLAWRSYLSQPLYHELLYWYLAKRTFAFLRQECNSNPSITLELLVTPRLASAFELLHLGGGPAVVMKHRRSNSNPVPPRWKRLAQRGYELVMLGGWRLQAWHLLAELDYDYRWRTCWHTGVPARFRSRAITFFSSYFNNSRTQKAFAPYMPTPTQWVFSNLSGREGAGAMQNPGAWLWQFAPKDLAHPLPSDDELETGDTQLDVWLKSSRVWVSWQRRELGALARLTWCWENYLETFKPRLCVMASAWGLDGWLSRIASAHGIATLDLLHGALGGYFYTKTPIKANGMIVWGEFWRNLWNEVEREKIAVFSPPELFPRIEKRPADKKRLTFFSWNTAVMPQYSHSELTDCILASLHELAQSPQVQITIRLHPAQHPADLVRFWEKKYGALPKNLRWSKREPLSEIIAETDVALMFRSTVMMNCLHNDIPVLIPGWIDFAWNDLLKDVNGIYLATGFKDMQDQMQKWLAVPPCGFKETAAMFANSTLNIVANFGQYVETLQSAFIVSDSPDIAK